jgi:hypothetical protein
MLDDTLDRRCLHRPDHRDFTTPAVAVITLLAHETAKKRSEIDFRWRQESHETVS